MSPTKSWFTQQIAEHAPKKAKPRKPIQRPEQALQQACVKIFDQIYPNHTFCLKANYSNTHNATQGGINKSMGVRPGQPDLELHVLATVFRMELKTPTGSQNAAEIEMQLFCESQFMHYTVIRSTQQFLDFILPLMAEHQAKYPKPYQVKWEKLKRNK